MTHIESKVQNDKAIVNAVDKAKKTVKKVAYPSLKKSFVTYAEVASRLMPPPKQGKKTRSIPSKLYKRNIFPISMMIKKDVRHRKLLIEKVRQGFRFVVYIRKRHTTLQFTKTLRSAKQRYGRIQYRGLYKWLWGANFSKIGQPTPTMFTRLLTKSPKLANKQNLSAFTQRQLQNEAEIQFNYKAQGIDYFANIAKRQAKSAMLKKLKKLFQSEVSNEIKKQNN